MEPVISLCTLAIVQERLASFFQVCMRSVSANVVAVSLKYSPDVSVLCSSFKVRFYVRYVLVKYVPKGPTRVFALSRIYFIGRADPIHVE